MLNRILIVWIVYAGVMGFAAGGSLVAAYQIPLSQHEASTEAEQSAANQNAKEKTDEALARYTLWLTIFTGVMAFAAVGLGIATVGLYTTGEKQIEIALKAANAADLNARAAVALELPLIRATPVGFGLGLAQSENGKRFEHFGLQCFEFSYQGRSKALPIELHWGWIVSDKLPTAPEFRLSKQFDLKITINENDGLGTLYVREFDMELSEGDTARITNRDPASQVRLWLYCSLAYDDFMYERHAIGFCWKYVDLFGGGRFIADATPAYNQRT